LLVLSIVSERLGPVQYREHMHTDPRTLGQRIAGLRHAQGWSQRRLAEAAGVSHGYVAQLELGRLPSPGKFRLDAIARALNLRTADALFSPPPASPFEPLTDQVIETDAPWAEPAESLLPDRLPVGAVPLGRGAEATSNPAARNDLPSATTGRNVLGGLDQLRASDAQPLPVFRWGSCGDPRDRESPPDPDHLEFPPPGRETLIGHAGFGVMIKGESMAGRGIYDGDVVWINPDRPYQLGKVVLALVTDVGGEAGMVVKTYARTDVGECLMSETTAHARSPVVCLEFKIIGPVVGITSWRLPS
jgi:transcriptional regulator with XRE-family HTH domain